MRKKTGDKDLLRNSRSLAFMVVILILVLPCRVCSGSEAGRNGAQEVVNMVGSGASIDVLRYIEQAEKEINSRDFRKARKNLEKTLSLDNGNEKARKMLAGLDQEEAISRAEKKERSSSFFFGLFSSPKKTSFERTEDVRETVDLPADTGAAEGSFREDNKASSVGAGRDHGTSQERYMREREKYEARKKTEDAAIRENISGARELLSRGDTEKARKKAYEAWKKIPYDTEVAVLIADINKASLLGPEGLKTDTYEGEDLLDVRQPPDKDPLLRHEEGKSFPDLGPMLMENIRGLYAEDEFAPKHDYPSGRYSVDDCVEIALRLSQRMNFADEQVKLGEARIWELRRKLFPDVALKMEKSFGKISEGNQGASRHYQGAKYMAEVKHTVFDGFGTYFEVRQAQSNLEIIKKERERIRNDIIEETKRAYYSLDKAARSLDIQYGILDRIKEFFDIADKAKQKGVIPEVEFLKVKGLYLQTDFQTISSERDVDLAHLVLVQAMNIDPDKGVKIEPLERPKEFLRIGLQNCYNLALANNPDLIIKEKTLEVYDFERKMAKSKGWPKIDFTGSFGKAIENYQPMREADDWTGNPIRAHRTLEPEWYAGVKGSIPIWGNTFEYNYVREKWATTVSAFRGTESATSYFTLRLLDDLAYFTGVQESRVGLERSKYEYQKAKHDIAMQVKTAYFKYRKSLLLMDVASAQVEHQKMFVDVLEQKQKFGEMDMSRLIEEYVKLGEHKYGVERGYTDYYTSILELNKSIGVMGYFHPWGATLEERSDREE
ncbi:MAG: TolC family protein [Candidatus Omnitrophota bacterium]